MSSTELFEAASISITSSELARAIDTHESHCPHGSIVGPRSQLRHAARILAIEVLPVPREPTNRYAWCTRSRATALRSVRTTACWPTTSSKLRGRCLRYSEGCCLEESSGGDTCAESTHAHMPALRPARAGSVGARDPPPHASFRPPRRAAGRRPRPPG